MGRRRGGGKAGQRGSIEVTETHPAGAASHHGLDVREAPVPGSIPRYEIPGWQERYGVVAGITGRGSEPGRGFDLGLWSNQPVGEVMSRWLAFRRGMAEFGTVVLGNQVHGTEVMTIERGPGWIQHQGVDGWITTTPHILLTVTVADCIPVYLVAPGRAIALLHAGWRGSAADILGRGVERLSSVAACPPSELVLHCGVGICGCCYEVGSEVLLGCGLAADGEGPWHLDLREHLTDRARALGIAQVSSSTWCSAHDRPAFYSHRASGGSDGRMVAYMGIAGKRETGKRGRSRQ